MDLVSPISAKELSTWVDGSIVGDPGRLVCSLSSAQELSDGALTFVSDEKMLPLVTSFAGAAVVIVASVPTATPSTHTYLVVPNPKRAFAAIASKLMPVSDRKGIDPTARISEGVIVAEGAYVGPYVVIESGCVVGTGSSIGAGSYLGYGVRVGEKTKIYPHVVLLDRVIVGDRVKIFSGTIVGSDGFGFVQEGEKHAEVPQIGTVIIENDVRIGAKCTIDRATLGNTRIGVGAKIDDQVHIGHNTVVGAHSILCAQVGLSGSVKLGKNVVLAGQVGIADHVNVGDGVRMGGQSGTSRDLESGQDYFLSPAIPMFQGYKVVSVLQKLPSLEKRLRSVEALLKNPGKGSEMGGR